MDNLSNKNIPVLLNLSNNLTITTLREQLQLTGDDQDKPKFASNALFVIRFLNKKMQLPLNLVDDNAFEDEDEIFALVNLPAKKQQSWENMNYQNNEDTQKLIDRQFLSNNHQKSLLDVYEFIQNPHQHSLNISIQIFNLFSKNEQIELTQNNVQTHKKGLYKVHGTDKKDKYSISFFGNYSLKEDTNNIIFNKFSLERIKSIINERKLQYHHTGFALGCLESKYGYIDLNGINEEKELKHLNFWRFRSTYKDHKEFLDQFSFYDL